MWTVAHTEEMRLHNHTKNATEFEECSHLPGELVPLNEFNYSNGFMGCVMNNNYFKVNFTGVSVSMQFMLFKLTVTLLLSLTQGPVRFNAAGTIIYTRIRLVQIREGNGMNFCVKIVTTEKSCKQGNPLRNTIRDTSTIMRNPFALGM